MASLTLPTSGYAPVESTKTDSLRITTALAQTAKAQDFVQCGGSQDRAWMVVADGHGGDQVIDSISSFDFGAILDGENSSELVPRLQAVTNGADSLGLSWRRGGGSTLSVVEMRDDTIQITWLGDSQVVVLEDGEEIFRTSPHNAESDRDLLGGRGTITSWAMSLNSQLEIVPTLSAYVIHGPYDKCNLVRALGHGGRCVNEPGTCLITHTPGKAYRVVVGSDGFWDMMSPCPDDKTLLLQSDAPALCDLAMRRWKQEWPYRTAEGVSQQRFEERDWDDIAIAVWDSR